MLNILYTVSDFCRCGVLESEKNMKKLIEFTNNWKRSVVAIGLVHLFT